ncbi:MAG: hypothetical protein N2749_01945, partial [Clostridia bacterium]|nr:hypothetical protein [Clostridia bacterium]
MKKILSTMLAISMIFISIPIHASEKSDGKIQKIDMKILKQFETSEEKVEICEINGVIYYYKDTIDKTITITKDLNGKIYISCKNKEINKLKTGEIELKYRYPKINLLEEFNNIVNSLSFDDKSFTNTVSLDKMQYTTKESEYEIAKRIDDKLKSVYGSPYNDKYISSLSELGETAYLYESMHFERYKYRSWALNAGTAIGI